MAYYPYNYSNPYNPAYMPGYNQPLQNTQPEKPQIQNSGFISVRTVEEAKSYPIAPGNSITFKVENSPYLCTKTMGFSQLEQPQFEVFRLVKEEESAIPEEKTEYALKTDLDNVIKRLEELETSIKEGV